MHCVSPFNYVHVAALIEAFPRILIEVAGISGLCMRACGKRLMNLGKTVYLLGSVTTPSVGAHNSLIPGSESGRTASLGDFC